MRLPITDNIKYCDDFDNYQCPDVADGDDCAGYWDDYATYVGESTYEYKDRKTGRQVATHRWETTDGYDYVVCAYCNAKLHARVGTFIIEEAIHLTHI